MTPEQVAAEAAVRQVLDGLGKAVGRDLPLPPAAVRALADLFLGAVAAVSGVSLKRAELAGVNEATKIATDADAARELGR